MKIHRVRCGILKNNNYIVEKNGRCLVIDLTDAKVVMDFIASRNLEVVGVLLTHSHWDHLYGVEEFLKTYNVPVYLGSKRPNYIDNHEFSYTQKKYGIKVTFTAKAIFLNEGSHSIEEFTFDVVEVPGHTYCSVIYYFKEVESMFTGDFLFRKTIGITATTYSNPDLMSESLKKIMFFKDEIHIYPGHGPLSILGREKLENPYLTGDLKVGE